MISVSLACPKYPKNLLETVVYAQESEISLRKEWEPLQILENDLHKIHICSELFKVPASENDLLQYTQL